MVLMSEFNMNNFKRQWRFEHQAVAVKFQTKRKSTFNQLLYKNWRMETMITMAKMYKK